MAASITTSLKVIKLQDHPIKLAHFDGTTWVALKSLASFLNLNYEKQARELAGNTTLQALGSSRIEARAKMMTDPEGVSDMWIPMGDVSLWASKLTMEDMTKLDRQNLCTQLLPGLMAKAF
jgi:hypothetical protein